MSKLYSIQESTLTDIGDALRSKYGETKAVNVEVPIAIVKNANATGFHEHGSWEYISDPTPYVIKCPGASCIKLAYSNTFPEDLSNGYIKYAIGEYTAESFPSNGTPLENTNDGFTRYLTIESDVVTLLYYKPFSVLGFYVECSCIDADGAFMMFDGASMVERETEVRNTYSSADMATAIENLNAVITNPIILSDNQSYGCAGMISSSYILLFGDTISTSDLADTNQMFMNNTCEVIPFDININNTASHNMNDMFYYCSNLKEAPKVYNARPNSMSNLFNGCNNLRIIPEGFSDTWNFTDLHNSSWNSASAIFQRCYSLRSVPPSFIKELYTAGSGSYYQATPNMFYYCYSIDEIIGISGHSTATQTSNLFNNTITSCSRLKRFVFDTNNGEPCVYNWKSQTIDFSLFVGYGSAVITNYILNYNTGITDDKQVNDNTTYQALKDDPDWYTPYSAYSRYNHDSAVETINSLPDTSAYLATAGGTNTIKFKGDSGSATDGGAISNLTEEEIAVATAKGWTVTLA